MIASAESGQFTGQRYGVLASFCTEFAARDGRLDVDMSIHHAVEREFSMLHYTALFTTQIDPTGEKRTQVEQKISNWLVKHYRHSLSYSAFQVVTAVVDTFLPVGLQSASITPSCLEWVKINLVRWRQGLKKLPRPTREEANQAGEKMLLLILQEICPDYVEITEEKEEQEEKPEVTALDLTLGYLAGMLSPEYTTGEDEIFETALEGTRLLKALGESSTFPHPYVELPFVPSLLFPLKNAETGEQIWIELSPTHYGFVVNAHRRKPRTRNVANPSRETAMGGIHVDYSIAPQPMENPFTQKGTPRQRWKRQQEILQIQLFDETAGPYDESHWLIPDDYSTFAPVSSVLLVRDVRRWKAPQEDLIEADVSAHQEAHVADGFLVSYQVSEGGHHA